MLEEREEAGGSAIENAGQIAVGATSIHKERGYDLTSDQFKAFLKACGTDGVPDELLDIFVYQGPEMIDWLTDIGVKWAPETIEDPTSSSSKTKTGRSIPTRFQGAA